MAVFHFNVLGNEVIPDDEGQELTDLAAARRFARRVAGDLLRDESSTAWTGDDWKLEVTDANGLVLFTLLLCALDAPVVGLRPRDTGRIGQLEL